MEEYYKVFYLDLNDKPQIFYGNKNQLNDIWLNLRASFNNLTSEPIKYIIHNDNGPAFIKYDNNGNILKEEFFINGLNSRLDGPAVIYYKKKKKYNLFYVRGKKEFFHDYFAFKTDHLICKNCQSFCKQECFNF